MKLSISNIAWEKENDSAILTEMKINGFDGLEIAPTRIFEEAPYDKIDEAKKFAKMMKEEYNLEISSIQSIFFGREECLFGLEDEREQLLAYGQKAIDFAAALQCHNLVFGCPKNRNIREEAQRGIAIAFFRDLGNYAASRDTTLALEPNPVIYNTNFINTTEQAFELVKEVNNSGFLVNLDLGTIIQNKETLSTVIENLPLVNHIHISEPHLAVIEYRDLHKELAGILEDNNYDKYVSIEMKNLNSIEQVKRVMGYVNKVFR